MNFQLKCHGKNCPPDVKTEIDQKIGRFRAILPSTAYMEIEIKRYAKAQGNGDKEAEVVVDIPGVKPVIRYMTRASTYLEAVDIILDRLDEKLSQRKHERSDYSYSGPSPKEWLADEMNKEELK
mgnify:CR=1 FL=1